MLAINVAQYFINKGVDINQSDNNNWVKYNFSIY